MPAKLVQIGKPKHRDEARGIQLVASTLPNDYVVYANVDLASGRRAGHTFEHDALVLAPHAVFAVELKSWGGRISGNRDRWTLEDGTPVPSPIPLIAEKARVLKGVLTARSRALNDVWVQGLVLVTGVDAQPFISPDYEHFVATPKTIAKCLTDPTVWGLSARKLDEAQKSTILRVFADGRPVEAPTHIGQHYLLERIASEGSGFEVWRARAPLGETRILHVYPIRGDSEKARKRALEHALREATLQSRIKGSPNLIDYCEYEVVDHPHSIVLRFEDTTSFISARTWIDEHNPGLLDRLRVAKQMASALAWIHDRDVVHRRLSIRAFLVTPELIPASVKLTDLELARDMQGRAPTVSSSALEDPTYRCMAPELVCFGESTPQSDLFSLGATFYELLTGRALFQRPEDVLRPVELSSLHVGDNPVPVEIVSLVAQLVERDRTHRPDNARDVVRLLDESIARLSMTTPPRRDTPEPGDVIQNVYQLVRHLGEGATGSSWEVQHALDGRRFVAKIADADKVDLLRNEANVLQLVTHPNLARYHEIAPYRTGSVLLVHHVQGFDGRTWIEAGDPLSPEQSLALGEGLFGAVGALHQAGYLHRDIKPENVILADRTARPTLIDLGLARLADEDGEITVGSIPYKDPILYEKGKWLVAHDLFAVWLVLYELLTGVHPFDHRPENAKRPRIETSLFPDSFAPNLADRLGTLFAQALSPNLDQRPPTATDAIAQWKAAFVEKAPADPPTTTRKRQKFASSVTASPWGLPDDLSLDASVDALLLSVRASSALERLGVSTVRQVLGLDKRHLDILPNVGRKTRAEIVDLKRTLAERFPEAAPAPPAPTPIQSVFYDRLLGDARSLTELGTVLTDRVRSALEKQSVATIGDLCALQEQSLKKVPGIGVQKISALRGALRVIAGEENRPDTLTELGKALENELGSAFQVLRLRCGLDDGHVVSTADCADRLGISRQRVSQACDVESLRVGASVAAWLVSAVDDILPRAGFAPLDAVATWLEPRYPPGTSASAKGYARLAAVLLEPGRRLIGTEDIEWVCRAPFTPELVIALREKLVQVANWPPVPRREAEAVLWDHLPPEIQGALRRFGADASALLDATRSVCPDVQHASDEALFTPPVSFAQAIERLKPRLHTGIGLHALQKILEEEFKAVGEPHNVHAELRAVGLELRQGVVVDAEDISQKPPAVLPIDPNIPRQIVRPTGPIDVRDLAAARALGGFRVVGLPPGKHHVLCEKLSAELAAVLGDEHVRFVDIDRVVIETLKEEDDRWADALFEDGRKEPRWGFVQETLQAALQVAIVGQTSQGPEARPGIVTVLGRPSLLGPLGLMPWLGGFYERARGGKFGLVVLALPGVVREGRVRLNDEYSLPYTPDMAAVCLVEEAGA
ncbi:MAG: protein kinase [Polyangiaceae bacterium]|nr:protein kinase [Polyangiaceae bacterium]